MMKRFIKRLEGLRRGWSKRSLGFAEDEVLVSAQCEAPTCWG